MRELFIIRHGEADHMVNNLTGGWSDSHLTDNGKWQATATGERLASLIALRPFQFHSSDLARTAETAELIAASLKARPQYSDGLRELNNGAAANLTSKEAAKIAVPITHPIVDWTPYPGAESWAAMSRRVESFMESIDNQADLTLLVLHAGSGNAAICWWLGLQVGRHNIAFELDPCSISHFRVNGYGERAVVKLNDTSHLIL